MTQTEKPCGGCGIPLTREHWSTYDVLRCYNTSCSRHYKTVHLPVATSPAPSAPTPLAGSPGPCLWCGAPLAWQHGAESEGFCFNRECKVQGLIQSPPFRAGCGCNEDDGTSAECKYACHHFVVPPAPVAPSESAPTAPVLCECGHIHETVTLDGVTSVFHRCRSCDCREWRAPAPSVADENVRAQWQAWRLALTETHQRRALVMAALHKLREGSGLSLRETARRAGLSAPTLSLAERLELDLSVEAADRLLSVLESARRGSPAIPEPQTDGQGEA